MDFAGQVEVICLIPYLTKKFSRAVQIVKKGFNKSEEVWHIEFLKY